MCLTEYTVIDMHCTYIYIFIAFNGCYMNKSMNEWGQYEWIKGDSNVAVEELWLSKSATASLRSLLEMQILGSHPNCTEPETLWVEHSNPCFNKSCKWFSYGFKFESHWERVKVKSVTPGRDWPEVAGRWPGVGGGGGRLGQPHSNSMKVSKKVSPSWSRQNANSFCS